MAVYPWALLQCDSGSRASGKSRGRQPLKHGPAKLAIAEATSATIHSLSNRNIYSNFHSRLRT